MKNYPLQTAFFAGIGLILIPHAPNADMLDKQKEALALIYEGADRICTRLSVEGEHRNVVISGGAEAQLNELLRKVASLDIEGRGAVEIENYKGVLREELGHAIRASDQCRLAVFDKLSVFLLSTQSSAEIQDSRIATTALPPQTDAQYENEYLRAVAMSASQDDTGEWITLSLIVENTTQQNVYLAYIGNPASGMAVDDKGGRYREYDMSGVYDVGNHYPKEDDFTVFSPSSRHTLVFTFRGDETNQRARIVSFSANFWFMTTEVPLQKLSIGISNIALL